MAVVFHEAVRIDQKIIKTAKIHVQFDAHEKIQAIREKIKTMCL